ncbi:hypothetical protein RM530_18335 [Algiphilus sp. W345]|uniref:Uncharacterized protein n=1 Tax=Banduia mediterranea TaxID=3075609 RepID=A0ABU2WP27_9GAMM|nr:hypothetical protein [Algiphilus sp. W345]MDT0499303.1 hypothetical protein [Algiphilus sp. W345]
MRLILVCLLVLLFDTAPARALNASSFDELLKKLRPIQLPYWVGHQVQRGGGSVTLNSVAVENFIVPALLQAPTLSFQIRELHIYAPRESELLAAEWRAHGKLPCRDKLLCVLVHHDRVGPVDYSASYLLVYTEQMQFVDASVLYFRADLVDGQGESAYAFFDSATKEAAGYKDYIQDFETTGVFEMEFAVGRRRPGERATADVHYRMYRVNKDGHIEKLAEGRSMRDETRPKGDAWRTLSND